MKKVIALVLLLTSAMTFFCGIVNGADTQFLSSASWSGSNNGVGFYYNAVQLYPYVISQGQQVSGGLEFYEYTDVILSVKIVNTTDNYKIIDPNTIKIQLILSVPSNGGEYYQKICDVVNFNGPLSVIFTDTDNRVEVVPTPDWTYNNYIWIPPHTALTGTSVLKYPARVQYTGNTGSLLYPTLTGVTQGVAFSVQNTTYTGRTGQSGNTDLSGVIGAINQVDTDTVAIKTYLQNTLLPDLINEIDEIIDVLTWNGSYSVLTFGNVVSKNVTNTSSLKIDIVSMSGVPTTDVEILPPDVVVTDTVYKIPVCVKIETNYDTDQTGYFQISNIFNYSGYSVETPVLYSSFANSCYVGVGSNRYYITIYTDDIIPAGKHVTTVWFNVYSRSSVIDFNNATNGSVITASTNTLTDESNALNSQSSAIHSQEQAYFNQNNQAIQSTGLSNYRFGNVEGNGIASVTNDFNSLWNSLGSWTTVYIFSLTLGLALTIIRHAPSAISRRRRNNKE